MLLHEQETVAIVGQKLVNKFPSALVVVVIGDAVLMFTEKWKDCPGRGPVLRLSGG